MSLIHLNNENFDDLIQNKVLVDFYATWCGPCKMLSPILEEISKECEIDIIKVDVDEHEETARKYGVMSIPTLILFSNGVEVKKHIGFIAKNELIDFIK